MRLKLSRDTKKGAGYAIIEASDSGVSAEGLRLSISRPGQEQPYLGSEGWQAAGTHIVPESVEGKDSKLIISLGPSIVQHMMQGNFRVSLKDGAEAESRAVSLPWRGIPAFAAPVGGTAQATQPEAKLASESRPMPQAETESELETSDQPNAGSVPDEQSVELDATADGGKGKFITAAIILLVVGGIAAFYYMGGDRMVAKSEHEQQPAEPVQSEEATQLTPPPQPQPDLSDVDAFLATGPSPEEAYQRSREAIKQGRGAEAAALLRYGAHKNHGPSQLLWGKIVDPSAPDRPQAVGLPELNANMAFDLFSRALKEGSPEACMELDRLRGWIEQEVTTGDPKIRMLQRLMKGVQC